MRATREGYYKKINFKNNSFSELDFLDTTISNLKKEINTETIMGWHTIGITDLGNFDLIAYNSYQRELLYWTIMVSNNIIDNFDYNLLNKNIVIPDLSTIGKFYFDNYITNDNNFIDLTDRSSKNLVRLDMINLYYLKYKLNFYSFELDSASSIICENIIAPNHELIFANGLLLKSNRYTITDDGNKSTITFNSTENIIKIQYFGYNIE